MKNNTYIVTKQNIITFLCLFLSGSFVVENDIISSTLTIALWVAVAIMLFSKRMIIEKKSMIALFALLMCMWISVVINEPNNYFKFVCVSFSILVVWLYVQKYTIESFCKSYTDVLFILATFSLIGFVAYQLVPSLNSMFLVSGKTGRAYSCLFLFVKSPRTIRNYGMFWEPGAFQVFLAIALLLEIKKDNSSLFRCIVYSVAIITTFSTTGYIALLFIWIICNEKARNLNIWKKSLILAFGAVVVYFFFNADSVLLQYSGQTVFGKLLDLQDLISNSDTSVITTTSVRYYSIIKPIGVFFRNPIIGVGYQRLNELLWNYTHGMNTFTFVNFFAYFGLIFGLSSVCGFWKFSGKISESHRQTIVTMIAMVLITMSENLVTFGILYWFIFYGYSNSKLLTTQNGVQEIV